MSAEAPGPSGPSPRGEPLLASCRSGRETARAILAQWGGGAPRAMEDVDFLFPDGETGVRLPAGVEGCDVFLVQCLADPASGAPLDRNYLALLVAARAFREAGAAHVTAVLPYLAYARQDKPTAGALEPTTARLVADLSAVAGIDRLVTWHPHCPQIRGFYAPLPVDAPDPLELFLEEFSGLRGREDVVAVAPDEGAARLVAAFGRALGVRCLVATKHRPERGRAAITELLGDLRGARTAIVIDDMISSGTTVREVIGALAASAELAGVHLAVSHNLCRPGASGILAELFERRHLLSVAVTDSVPQTPEVLALPFLTVRPLASRLARLIRAIHEQSAGSPAT